MKRTIFKTMAVLMALLACLSLHAVNSITYTTAYNDSALTLGTDTLGGVTYSTISYEGLYNGGAPGTPSLPIDYIRFSVPWNATNFTVSATTINNPIQPLGYQLYPNQLPQLISDTIGWSITLPDSSAYQNNVFYPANRAWVVDEGFLAGENHIVTVAVMPVDYRHRLTSYMNQHQYRLSRAVNLTLSYDLSDTLAMYPIVRQDTALRSEGYRLAQRMVVNPGNVITNAPTSMMPDTMIVVNLGSGAGEGLRYGIDSTGVYYDTIPINHEVAQMAEHNYPYLIVTTPEMEHAVRRIAALKNQKGLRTKVVTMDEVINNSYTRYGYLIKKPNGTYFVENSDNEGKLRQFLKLYYEFFGTKYVLLAGSGIPYGKARPYFAPCDMYFTDFQSDFHFEISDRHPEIYVGRLLAKSPNQIINYTDKLFRYELNPGHGNPSYLKRSIYTECLDMIGESRKTRQNFSNFFSDTTIIEVEGSGLPKGLDIINEINSTKYGFMSFHNHGTPSGVALYGIKNINAQSTVYGNVVNWIWAIDSVHVFDCSVENNENIGNALNLMNNKYYPNILYTIACTTMPYDTISHYGSIPMNFGESFTTGKDYGGPAFLGNTREGLVKWASELEEIFALKIQEGYYKLGMAEALSKETYTLNQVNTVHNLLGDPEFEIWTDIPQQFSGITVTCCDSTIVISGINANSVIVSVCNVNNQIVTKIVSEDSVTINHISPNSSIMLHKHNYIPYIAPMNLQNVTLNNSQYVIASDVTMGSSVGGDVTVQNGTEYEIEASGTVTLNDGFKVEKGATFAVYPSSF